MVLDGNAQGGLIGNLQAGVGWVTGALVSPVTDDNFTMTMMMIAAMGVLGGALKGVTLGRLATTVLQRAGSVVLGGFGLSNLASWWNNPAQTTSDVKQGSGNLNAAFTMLAGALILFSPMLFKPNSKALGPVLDGTVVSGTTASQVVDDMIARMGPGTFSTQSGAWKVLQNNKVWLALQELKDGSLVILSSEGKMVRYVRSADDQWVLDGMESFTAASAQDIVANGGKVGFNPQATASGPEVASTSGTLATTGARPPPEGTGLREAGATVVAAKGTQAFRHYGYAEDAAKFQGGLRPGSYATHNRGRPMHGPTAQNRLALPNEAPPNAYYKVRVGPETPVGGPRPVSPTAIPPRAGGGIEYTFPRGTSPGSVEGPFLIP